MPLRRLSRALLAAIASGSVGVLHKVVSLNGFKYGSLGEIPGAEGISSDSPRTERTDTLLAQALDFRSVAGAPVSAMAPQLTEIGATPSSLDRGQTFDFEWGSSGRPEGIVGSLAQADVSFALVQPDVPTTCDHGVVVDACMVSSPAVMGLTQTVPVPGGGSLNGRVFTLSVYNAPIDPASTSFPIATLTIQSMLGSTVLEARSAIITGPTAGRYNRSTLVAAAFTAASATATTIRVVVRRNSTTPNLFAAAQLEEAGAATAYERTSNTADGVRNLLLGSHFPTRSPWTILQPSGTVTITPDAGRGPEIRAIVPTPGTVEFGSGLTGLNVGNGLMQMKPYDAYGQTAGRTNATSAGSGPYAIRKGLSPAGKTYVCSVWVRHIGVNIPSTGVDIYLASQVTDFVEVEGGRGATFPLTSTWRRIWFCKTFTSASASCTQVEAFLRAPLGAASQVEWFGIMLQQIAGTDPQPPADYEATSGTPGSVNILHHSNLGTWANTSGSIYAISNGTKTANTGYAPIEYYDVVHEDFGASPNRLRINPGGNDTLLDEWHSEDGYGKSAFSGLAYSIGAYGAEILGEYGNLNWNQEQLLNGDFELWGSASDATSWSEVVPTGVTVNRDSVVKSQGSFSYRIDRTDGAPFGGLYQGLSGLFPGKWYKITVVCKADIGGMAGSARAYLLNSTESLYANSDGVTWGAGHLLSQTATTSFLTYSVWVQIRSDFALSDAYSFGLTPYFTAGHSVWYDEASFDGPYNTASVDDPYLNGWAITGGTQYWLKADTVPEVWADDEEAGPPQGVKHLVAASTNPPTRYASLSGITLAVGWHTIRFRCARVGGNTGSTPYIALVNGSGNYLDFDRVGWPDSTVRWLKPTSRYHGIYAPDYGVAVYHIYVAAAGSHTLRIGAYSTAAQAIFIDQLRIWSDAGALYASTDRTETAGNSGCLFQGFNVLFRGVIDDSVTADDDRIKVRCRDYAHGTLQQIPSWTTTPNCQVKFGGNECGYVSTTTSTGDAGVQTTHATAALGTALLEAGRYLRHPSGTGRVKILTILSTASFTTDIACQWANGAVIAYADCRHDGPDCDRRDRTHRYSGCRATQALQAMGGTPLYHKQDARVFRDDYEHPNWGSQMVRASAAQLFGAISITGQATLGDKKIFDDTSIPIVYGRKSVKGIPVETHATKFSTDDSEWLTTFYVFGMGEVSDVRAFFTPDGPIVHSPVEGVMVFWHPGRQGEDLWWTLANQYAASNEDIQKINNQRRDFRTNTNNAYNRMMYAVVQIKKGNPLVDLNDPTKILELWADQKARSVQIYDRYGVEVGSPTWSRNPIWIAVDAMLNSVFGPGLPKSVIDWPTMVESADICDEVLTSVVAKTQVRSTTGGVLGDRWGMTGIDGFTPEMNVNMGNGVAWAASTPYTASISVVSNDSGKLYWCITTGTSAGIGGPTGTSANIPDGTAHWQYIGPVANRVLFVDPINLRLFFETAFKAFTGLVIQGLPARFTCDLAVSSKTDLATFLDMVMSSCRGFLTFDGGKLGIVIEEAAASAPSTSVFNIGTPTPATLLGVIPDSVEYGGRRGSGSNYNVLEVTYECGQLLAGSNRVYRFADADRGGLDFPRVLKIAATGCDTAEQALRASLCRYAKACSAFGAGDAAADVRGTKVTSGIALLRVQVGDFIILSRPPMTTSQRSRIRAVTINDDFTVTVETAPEARAVRSDAFGAPFDTYSDAPLLGSAMGTQLPLGLISLSVDVSSNMQVRATISVTGYNPGPGDSAGDHLQRFIAFELHASLTSGFTPTTGRLGAGGTCIAVIDPSVSEFVWHVPYSRIEQTYYLKAVGLIGGIDDDVAVSGEVTVTTFFTDRPVSDPTQQEGSSQTNLIHGSDLQNPLGVDWFSDASPPFPGIAAGGNYIAPTAITTPVSPDPSPQTGETYVSLKDEGGVSAVVVGKINDNNIATYGQGNATFHQASAGAAKAWVQASLLFKTFSGGGTGKNCRPYVQVVVPAQAGQYDTGSIDYFYTLDVTVGTPVWVQFTPSGGPAGASPTDLYGPILYGVDYTKFAVCCLINASTVTLTFPEHPSYPLDNAYRARVLRAGVEQAAVTTYGGSISNKEAIIFGDGTTNYGRIQRPFPGKTPTPNQVVFNASTLNHFRMTLRKAVSTDTLDANPVQMRVYDAAAQDHEWILGSIPSYEIETARNDFAVKFAMGTDVVGDDLRIEVRTLNTKPIAVSKLLVAPGDTLFAWGPGPEDQANGYFGDFHHGIARGFTKGRWIAGDRKKSPVY